MARYRMYNCEVDAIRIDKEWLRHLMYDRKMSDVHLGDYLVKGIDGTEEVMPAKRFERIFFKLDETVPDGI